mmetsp:Transcript_39798/g.38348  ORF Transcript_39798/g.38348 Transcript_39798/m.38348 type:complete len:135 (+) Transcript_39798:382-786(+)
MPNQSNIEYEYDYSLLGQLIAFLDKDELFPILCGYFNKIVQSLMNKQKVEFLQYILLERNGDLFLKLLKHMKHHSLGTLLIELIQIKVTSKNYSYEKIVEMKKERANPSEKKEEQKLDGENEDQDYETEYLSDR